RRKKRGKNMKVFIIGIKKAKTKNGRDFCQYYFQKAFTDYEMQNSDCIGMVVGSEFSYKDYNLKPGDECDFMYEPGFEGKATLSDVVVLKPVGNGKGGNDK
ncbi:MAG: hypothetical protein K2P23_09490, partial [Lachnospiraceae bacterium]|nr:hypothetical protein [Lachnospiraceae bacterium]